MAANQNDSHAVDNLYGRIDAGVSDAWTTLFRWKVRGAFQPSSTPHYTARTRSISGLVGRFARAPAQVHTEGWLTLVQIGNVWREGSRTNVATDGTTATRNNARVSVFTGERWCAGGRWTSYFRNDRRWICERPPTADRETNELRERPGKWARGLRAASWERTL